MRPHDQFGQVIREGNEDNVNEINGNEQGGKKLLGFIQQMTHCLFGFPFAFPKAYSLLNYQRYQ